MATLIEFVARLTDAQLRAYEKARENFCGPRGKFKLAGVTKKVRKTIVIEGDAAWVDATCGDNACVNEERPIFTAPNRGSITLISQVEE